MSVDTANPHKLSNRQLRDKIKTISFNVRLWKNKFIALLPEIAKRKLWQEEGFEGLKHYVNVKAALTDDILRRVLNTYDKLEPFPTFVKLFHEGNVGWSLFEIIAPVLNKSNSRHFYKRIQNDTAKVLKRLVDSIKEKQSLKEKATGYGTGQSQGNGVTSSVQRLSTVTRNVALPQNLQNSLFTQAIGGSDRAKEQTNELILLTEAQVEMALPSQTLGTSASNDTNSCPCEACGHVDGSAVNRRGGRKLVPLYVCATVRELCLRLLHEWRKKGQKVKMSDVLERMALFTLQEGLELEIDGEAAATATKLDKEQKRVTVVKATSTKDKFWWKRPYVQLINYDVKTGACFTKTYDGWERVNEEELANQIAMEESPIDLQELRLVAKERAAEYLTKHLEEGKPISDYIPQQIRKYIWLRSGGGFCEFPGCRSRATKIHHLKRFLLDPDCDPDGLIHLCDDCHDLFHSGAVENEHGPFKDFKLRLNYSNGSIQEQKMQRVDEKTRKRKRYAWPHEPWSDAEKQNRRLMKPPRPTAKIESAYPMPRRQKKTG